MSKTVVASFLACPPSTASCYFDPFRQKTFRASSRRTLQLIGLPLSISSSDPPELFRNSGKLARERICRTQHLFLLDHQHRRPRWKRDGRRAPGTLQQRLKTFRRSLERNSVKECRRKCLTRISPDSSNTVIIVAMPRLVPTQLRSETLFF